MEGKIISQKNLKNLRIPGNSLVNVAEVKPKISKTDLYSIEYDLNDSKNLLKGKSIDLVYIQSS
jgi:hypothetical protein